MSLLIDQLSVTGFRGIDGPVHLDLSAPLTLLYAPNGCGKSSIFEALAWLLYGKTSPDDAICSRTRGRLAQPQVTAQARILAADGDTTHLKLSRNFGASVVGSTDTESFHGLDLWKRLAKNRDLSDFMPQGGGRERRYREIVRATRFLSSDSAETMALYDEKNIDSEHARSLLFADLTNTTNLAAELKQATQYRSDLESGLRDHTKKLTATEKALKTAQERMSALLDLAPMMQRLSALLDRPIDSDNTANTLAAVETDIAQRVAMRKLQRRDLDTLLELVSMRVDDRLQVEALEQRCHRADAELADKERGVEQAVSLIAENLQADDEREQRLQALTAARNKIRALLHIDATLATWRPAQRHEAAVSTQRPVGLAALVELYAQREQWLGILADIARNVEAIEQQHARLTRLDVVNPKTLAAAEAELASTEESVRAESEHLEALRRMALAWQQRANGAHCPCCHHEWTSAQALTEALMHVANPISQTVTRQLALRESVDTLRAARAQRDHEARCLADLQDRDRELNRQLDHFRQLAAPIGIDLRAGTQTVLLSERDSSLTSLLQNIEQSANLRYDEPDGTLSSMQAALSGELGRLEMDRSVAQISTNELQQRLTILRTQTDLLRKEIAELPVGLATLRARLKKGTELAESLAIASPSVEGIDGQRRQIDATELRDAEAVAILDRLGQATMIQREALGVPALQDEQFALERKCQKISDEIATARSLEEFINQQMSTRGERFFSSVGGPISELFGHMQINRAFERIQFNHASNGFQARGQVDRDTELHPIKHFSQGQQQDLALAMFLARAATLGGSFFLDEPLRHLDDLNRTALLDVLRAAVLATRDRPFPIQMLVTTASRMVVDHLIQKFQPLMRGSQNRWFPLRVFELSGNPRTGVTCRQVFPLVQPDRQSGEGGSRIPQPEIMPSVGRANQLPEHFVH